MNVLTGFHPAFDALSSYADQPDIDAARSRVGRHVARCDACRATIAEIRALGEAARGVELPAAPADLWARIERARADGAGREAPRETPPAESDAFRDAPALRPTRHLPSPSRRAVRGGLLALAAAGVVLALLLVPTSGGRPLQAGTNAGTWHFSPARPAPGATVTVRYVPGARERWPNAMLLLGGFARPLGDRSGRLHNGLDALQDSLAMLVRDADGSYRGRFTLPPDFSAMVARLAFPDGRRRPRIMTTGGPVSRGYEPVELLVAGDAGGAPSLPSLTAALDLWAGGGVTAYRVADTLVKYFPAEPIGPASIEAPRSRRLLDALVGWFASGERQYLKFDRRFMEQPTVSVEHALAMIRFANRIDEPAELRKWTMRLVREHGDDPRALYLYSSMLSGMFNRPNTVDSVRAGLPLADTVWERNGHLGANEELVRAAATVHDVAAARRWALRAMQEGSFTWRGDPIGVSVDALDDPEIRRAAVPLVRASLARSCERPTGKYSFWEDQATWVAQCVAGRAGDYQRLSRVARLDGDPARALLLADSSMALMASTGNCWQGGSHVMRGEALLAMGRAAAAAPELAWGAGWGSWQSKAYRDSVGRLLRPAVDSARWDAAIAAVTAERNACVESVNRRRQQEAEAMRRAAAADSLRR